MLGNGNCSNVNQMASASIGAAPSIQPAPYLPPQQPIFNNSLGAVGADQFSVANPYGVLPQQQYALAMQTQGANPFGLGGNNLLADGQDYLADLQGAIQQGVIPSLGDLVNQMPPFPPESVEGQQLRNRAIQLLVESGPQGQERAKQFALVQAMRQLQSVTGSLFTISSNLQPGSPQYQALQQRLAAIGGLHAALGQQLNQSLSQDPSHGQTIQLRPPQPPQQQFFGQIVGMMQMMLQMMMQLFNRQQA